MRIYLIIFFLSFFHGAVAQPKPAMFFADSSRLGRPLAKDPKVVFFKNQYLMYYSIPQNDKLGWGIGIATSKDLVNWKKISEIQPEQPYEQKGICAPGAMIRNDTLHLFYQTYGNGRNDAICHAWSVDGIKFIRNTTNPVFRPTGAWNCGRAIDAEVVLFNNKYFLYFATRDSAYKIQMQGVATTSIQSSFTKNEWTQAVDSSILKPTLPWEINCVEGASIIVINKSLYMFYAGGYNNEPQQIGVAKSEDGIKWQRLSGNPFLTNGSKGSWNESESGHPDIFRNKNGELYLFYQGNADRGRTWYLSNRKLRFRNEKFEFVSS